MKATVTFALIAFASLSQAADLELKNPDFEKGKQFWRGDGKVTTVEGGGKVLELKADDRYSDTISQEFNAGDATMFEITLKARGVKYKGNGLRISVQRRGGGAMIYSKGVSDTWGDHKVIYHRNTPEEKFTLHIEPQMGSGVIQIDDVKVAATSKSGNAQ